MSSVHIKRITLNVNGHPHLLDVAHHWTLLRVLRDSLDLTGAKPGCDRGECGSCTVLLDGSPVYSCQLLALQVDGRSVLTIEGLAANSGELHPIQQSFLANDGSQCGYCAPGFLLSTKALLDSNPAPSEEEIRSALSGNICRCNAYGRIINSVLEAAKLLRNE